MSRTKQVVPAIGVASLALLAGGWASRRSAPFETLPQAPRAAVLSVQPPESEPAAWPEDVDFWNPVGEPADREAVLRRTVEVLGLSLEDAQTFRSATLSAVEAVDRAWAVRESGWIAVSSSAASDPELLGRLEGEIQSRYESEKERALQRVAARLGAGERHERFRERLEEWFDSLR
jgi:hypothetical protein